MLPRLLPHVTRTRMRVRFASLMPNVCRRAARTCNVICALCGHGVKPRGAPGRVRTSQLRTFVSSKTNRIMLTWHTRLASMAQDFKPISTPSSREHHVELAPTELVHQHNQTPRSGAQLGTRGYIPTPYSGPDVWNDNNKPVEQTALPAADVQENPVQDNTKGILDFVPSVRATNNSPGPTSWELAVTSPLGPLAIALEHLMEYLTGKPVYAAATGRAALEAVVPRSQSVSHGSVFGMEVYNQALALLLGGTFGKAGALGPNGIVNAPGHLHDPEAVLWGGFTCNLIKDEWWGVGSTIFFRLDEADPKTGQRKISIHVTAGGSGRMTPSNIGRIPNKTQMGIGLSEAFVWSDPEKTGFTFPGSRLTVGPYGLSVGETPYGAAIELSEQNVANITLAEGLIGGALNTKVTPASLKKYMGGLDIACGFQGLVGHPNVRNYTGPLFDFVGPYIKSWERFTKKELPEGVGKGWRWIRENTTDSAPPYLSEAPADGANVRGASGYGLK